MSGAFETNVQLLCFSSSKEAEASATKEASVSAGTVVSVGRVEVNDTSVCFLGHIPRMVAKARFLRNYNDLTSSISFYPPLPCSLHTTWESIIKPGQPVGFLSLNEFGRIWQATSVKDWHDDEGMPETVLCRLYFERVLFSMTGGEYGRVYCNECGMFIQEERIFAIPGVRLCVQCKDNQEAI